MPPKTGRKFYTSWNVNHSLTMQVSQVQCRSKWGRDSKKQKEVSFFIDYLLNVIYRLLFLYLVNWVRDKSISVLNTPLCYTLPLFHNVKSKKISKPYSYSLVWQQEAQRGSVFCWFLLKNLYSMFFYSIHNNVLKIP